MDAVTHRLTGQMGTFSHRCQQCSLADLLCKICDKSANIGCDDSIVSWPFTLPAEMSALYPNLRSLNVHVFGMWQEAIAPVGNRVTHIEPLIFYILYNYI